MRDRSKPALAAGIYAALITPRRPDSIEADTAAYFEYLDRVSNAGVDGLVFFGSTGEFVHFEVEERMRVTGLAVKRSRVPVLVNVSHSTLSGARNLADHAVDSGAHGLLVAPPYFYVYEPAEIENFYQQFAAAVARRIPIYLYNLPMFTSPIPLASMERLLRSGEFCGIKDSSGDWELFERLIDLRSGVQFQLLAGSESVYARGLRLGLNGTVSGVAAAVPELLVALQKAACGGEPDSVTRLSAQLEQFVSWSARFPATVAIKDAAHRRKWARSAPALPLSRETCNRLAEFGDWFDRWLPETLEMCSKAAAMRP